MQQTYRMTMMLKDRKTTILTLKAISAEAAISRQNVARYYIRRR